MNYYEELGIQQDATTQQIHEAYKLAARLLHPDNQREPRLKDLAECQMKRLGDVVAVLLNAQERAGYDAGLANGSRLGRRAPVEPLAPAGGSKLLETVVRNWFWVLLGSLTLGMSVWYGLARDPEAPPGPAAAEIAKAPSAPVKAPGERAPVKKQQVQPSEPLGARARLPLGHPALEEPEPRVSAPAPTSAEAPARAAEEKPAGVPAAQKSEPDEGARSGGESRFAGEWLFMADGREGGSAGTYPATYVECRLREESGKMTGDYRALHRVTDKAISAEVVFHVRGEAPAGNTGKLEWESSAGARGEVELTLLPPNQLQVRWWTTRFGKREALSSGMAVLIRLKTP